jgi:hypothetical protein
MHGENRESKDRWPHFGARIRILRKALPEEKNQADHRTAVVRFYNAKISATPRENGQGQIDRLLAQRYDDAQLKKFLDLKMLQRVDITWESSSQVEMSALPWPFSLAIRPRDLESRGDHAGPDGSS